MRHGWRGAHLEPDARQLAERLEAPPYLHEFDPSAAREAVLELQSGPVRLAPSEIDEAVVALPAGTLPVTVCHPRAAVRPTPVAVYLHGGAGTVGSFATHEGLVRDLASRSGVAVVFPEYLLSPEARHPAALLQCHQLLGWLARHGGELGVDGDRLAVAGDSTGATMATALALICAERGPALSAQLLYYPVVQAGARRLAGRAYVDCPLLPLEALVAGWRSHLGPGGDQRDPWVSPLLAPRDRLREVAPAMVVTAEVDVSRDDAEDYGLRLAACGVPVEAVRVRGCTHHFVVANALRHTDAARLAISLGADYLRRTTSRSP